MLLAASAGLLGFEATSALAQRLLGKPALGLGDAKLAALLGAYPGRYGAWLWLWAILVMLPQPAWLLPVQGGLAALSWWRIQQDLIPEQGLLVGLVGILLDLGQVV